MGISFYIESITESIARILNTPLGSRVMEPEFGSMLYTLVDKRPDDRWRLLLIRYTFDAIEKWEPRIKLLRILPQQVGEKTAILLEFEIVASGEIGAVKVEI